MPAKIGGAGNIRPASAYDRTKLDGAGFCPAQPLQDEGDPAGHDHHEIGTPLQWTELPDRRSGPGQIRVRVSACGIRRTELHVFDGELSCPILPIIPGQEIVSRSDESGYRVDVVKCGDRVRIPWIGHTCGVSSYCRAQRESLCDAPLFASDPRDGDFATATIADARFALPLGEVSCDMSLASLRCACLIPGAS
jgi:propanol-preferring alcohol dehydrogenase